MSVTETVFVLRTGAPLTGVITHPAPGGAVRDLPAVLLLDPGLHHHAGPQRLYVKLARRLAERGFLVLRMDFSGIGDSPYREDGVSRSDSEMLETRAAMAQLAAEFGASRFVLAGLCSGAVPAMEAAWEDPRIGAVLINPFALAANAGPHGRLNLEGRVFGRALASGSSWRRILTGRAEYGAALGQLRNYVRSLFYRGARRTEKQSILERLSAMAEREQPLFFILAEGDPAHLYLEALLAAPSAGALRAKLNVQVIEDGTHMFATLKAQQALFEAIETRLERSYLGL